MLLIVVPALCLFLCPYLLWQALVRERELRSELASVRAVSDEIIDGLISDLEAVRSSLGSSSGLLDATCDELDATRDELDATRDELDTTSREVLKLRGDLLDAHRAYEERCSLHQNAMRHATAEQDSLHAWVQRLVNLHTVTSSSYMALLRLRNRAVDGEYHGGNQEAQIRVLLQMVDGRDAEIAATSNAFLTRLREWNQI